MELESLIEDLKETPTDAEKLKALQEELRLERHLHDDHGSAIIGGRDHPPAFNE